MCPALDEAIPCAPNSVPAATRQLWPPKVTTLASDRAGPRPDLGEARIVADFFSRGVRVVEDLHRDNPIGSVELEQVNAVELDLAAFGQRPVLPCG